MWAKKVENLRVGCVPERTWSFVVCSGVAERGHSDSRLRSACLELEAAEMSTEIDGQLFHCAGQPTDGERFDVVMSAEGDHGFESTQVQVYGHAQVQVYVFVKSIRTRVGTSTSTQKETHLK